MKRSQQLRIDLFSCYDSDQNDSIRFAFQLLKLKWSLLHVVNEMKWWKQFADLSLAAFQFYNHEKTAALRCSKNNKCSNLYLYLWLPINYIIFFSPVRQLLKFKSEVLGLILEYLLNKPTNDGYCEHIRTSVTTIICIFVSNRCSTEWKERTGRWWLTNQRWRARIIRNLTWW